MQQIHAEILALIAAQAVSSFLSTATLHAAIGNSLTRFVATAAISDAVKLSIYVCAALMASKGSWHGVAAAVAGGVIGNALAHHVRHKK